MPALPSFRFFSRLVASIRISRLSFSSGFGDGSGMENQSLTGMLIHWVVSAAALLFTSKLIPGFKVAGFGSALWAAVVIGLANIMIWPLLIFLTLPINILTFGLFTFVVNGAVLKICAALIKGFDIKGWMPAIIGAVVLSVMGTFLHYLVG